MFQYKLTKKIFDRFGSNTYYIVAELLAKASNVLMLLIIPLLISVKGYGLISLLYSVEVIFTSLVFFGHDQSIIRFFHRLSISRPLLFSYYRKWFFRRVPLIVMFLSFSMFAVSLITNNIIYIYLLAMVVSAYLLAQIRLVSILLRLHEQSSLYLYYRVGCQFLRFFMVIFAFNVSKSLAMFPCAVVVSGLIGALAPVVFKKSFGEYTLVAAGHSKKHCSKKIVNRVINNFSFPVMVANLIGLLYLYVDRWAVSFFLSIHDVGIYSFAVTIGSLIFFIYSILSLIYLPEFYRQKNYSNAAKKILNNYIKVSLPLAATIGLFCIPFFIIYTKYFVPEYSEGFVVFIVTLVSFLIYPFYLYGMYVLKFFRKTYLVLAQIIVSLIVNLVLNFAMIPLLGIDGAAWATLLTVVFDVISINMIAYCSGSRYAPT
jgi:O-antigen/teichoic acid export membrane protein